MSAPGDLWSSFDHDPRLPANAPLRAADRDRDVIRTALATAYAEGRLDRDEFDERSEQVTSARTLGELPPIVADLVPDRAIELRSRSSLVGASPQELRRRAELHWQAERRNAIVGFIGASLVTWAIWLATSLDNGVRPLLPVAADRDGPLARERGPDPGHQGRLDRRRRPLPREEAGQAAAIQEAPTNDDSATTPRPQRDPQGAGQPPVGGAAGRPAGRGARLPVPRRLDRWAAPSWAWSRWASC